MDFNKKSMPYHVAIIPDGNRRWAKKRDRKPWKGHKAGAEAIEELSKEALKMGVKSLTFWGSSKDNLTKRPFEEKRELLKIYEEYFKKLINSSDIFENKTKIQIIGRWEEQFPKRLKKILEEGIEKTKNHTGSFLNFLLAYSGDDDILHAVKEIKKEARNKARDFKMNKEAFQSYLVSSKLPSVDLVIRTGVEDDPHNSAGFLMWQTQNSQYYFSEKLFPDFNATELKKALEDFANRERRLGK
ncbi:MAG: polyprenyl diphosphate synthase [Candidatus Moraniibacteriota bacterium]